VKGSREYILHIKYTKKIYIYKYTKRVLSPYPLTASASASAAAVMQVFDNNMVS